MSDRQVPLKTRQPPSSTNPDRSVRQRTDHAMRSTSSGQGGISDSPAPSRRQSRQQNVGATTTSQPGGQNSRQTSGATGTLRSSRPTNHENVDGTATSPPRGVIQQRNIGATSTPSQEGAQPSQGRETTVLQHKIDFQNRPQRSENRMQKLVRNTTSEEMSDEFGHDEFRFELALKISPKAETLHERTLAAFVRSLAQSYNGMVPPPTHQFCPTVFKLGDDSERHSWRFVEYDDESRSSRLPGESPVST